MQIRELKPDDLTMIARVNVDTFRETHGAFVPDSFVRDLSYEGAEQRFKRMLRKAEDLSTIFVAEDSGDVIGYAMCGLAREKVLHYQGELYSIYILPQYHGKGIGRRLLNSVSKHLRMQGANSMFVVVFSENISGRKFYEVLGGQCVEERTIELRGADVRETIYGWNSLETLLLPNK